MSIKKRQYDSHVKAAIANRVAETTKFTIDFATDPETALLDDPTGPPDWNRALDACAAGAVKAHDRSLHEIPEFVRIGREYVDQCFEWQYEKTPSQYAAERELTADSHQVEGNSRFEEIKEEIATGNERDRSRDIGIDR